MSSAVSSSALKAITKVLHIRPAPVDGDCGAKMDAVLETLPFAVQNCGDVYRGLARLCREKEGQEAWQAIFVCVDGLGSAEMEFFSIVSRTRRDLDVYVYGGDRSASQVARAIERGASGEATEEVVRKLAAMPVTESRVGSAPPEVPRGESAANSEAPTVQHPGTGESAREPSPHPAASDVAASIAQVEPSVSASAEPGATTSDQQHADIAGIPSTATPAEPPETTSDETSAAQADETEAREEADDKASAATVRVPWLRYGDGPARTPPKRSESSPNRSESPRRSASKASPQHEPLLTDEELQALLGDDIAAITPEDGDTGGPRKHGDGEASL